MQVAHPHLLLQAAGGLKRQIAGLGVTVKRTGNALDRMGESVLSLASRTMEGMKQDNQRTLGQMRRQFDQTVDGLFKSRGRILHLEPRVFC